MTALTNFFKESDSALGVFYPRHYIIAAFPNFAKAKLGEYALRRAGFSEDETRSIRGGEILQFFDEFREHSGPWSSMMSELSRIFGTEQTFADDDASRAHSGAGFLAVYSPEEAEGYRIRTLLEPLAPLAMHWYRSGCVESLV